MPLTWYKSQSVQDMVIDKVSRGYKDTVKLR